MYIVLFFFNGPWRCVFFGTALLRGFHTVTSRVIIRLLRATARWKVETRSFPTRYWNPFSDFYIQSYDLYHPEKNIVFGQIWVVWKSTIGPNRVLPKKTHRPGVLKKNKLYSESALLPMCKVILQVRTRIDWPSTLVGDIYKTASSYGSLARMKQHNFTFVTNS